jgi:hypothetical protein
MILDQLKYLGKFSPGIENANIDRHIDHFCCLYLCETNALGYWLTESRIRHLFWTIITIYFCPFVKPKLAAKNLMTRSVLYRCGVALAVGS